MTAHEPIPERTEARPKRRGENDNEVKPAEALRLVRARRERGFEDAKSACEYFGWIYDTYIQHERGERGLRRDVAVRYARAYRVSAAWLLTGEGEVPIRGEVGAGGEVEWYERGAPPGEPDTLLLPSLGSTGAAEALIIRGDSQYPRFLDGEALLFDPTAVEPGELIGQYAVVQTLEDARRLIKILRRDPAGGEGRFRLESHNAAPEDGVRLLGAWRYLGLIPRPGAARPQGRKK